MVFGGGLFGSWGLFFPFWRVLKSMFFLIFSCFFHFFSLFFTFWGFLGGDYRKAEDFGVWEVLLEVFGVWEVLLGSGWYFSGLGWSTLDFFRSWGGWLGLIFPGLGSS